jgi:hypothetical protein
MGGVKIEVQSLEPGAPMPGFPDAVYGFMAALETYDSPQPVSSAEAESVFGVRLTTLESSCADKQQRCNLRRRTCNHPKNSVTGDIVALR